jgi:hypothetical protein
VPEPPSRRLIAIRIISVDSVGWRGDYGRRRRRRVFESKGQGDLFGSEPTPVYRPDPDKVRARLHKILAEARAADKIPWGAGRLSLYRTIVPQMASFLPGEEGAQLRFQFEEELARLQAA